MKDRLELPEAGLANLESLWDGDLRDHYAFYSSHAEPRVALAAALVETAVQLQGLGVRVAAPSELLTGDLCLARASRLLADTRDQHLQVAFASAIEKLSAGAAAGLELPPARDLLLNAIGALE